MEMSHKEEVVVDASGSGSLLQRRVEFHLARKPVSAYPNTCNFKLETLNPCTSSPSSRPLPVRPSSNKSDSSDFFETSLDPDLSFRIPFRRIGAGLENLGNTCFLNSVLQCLTYTEPLVAYLQSGKHQNTCHVAGFCALCAIQKHVSRALQSTGRILAPKDLVSNLRCISRNFRNARQEDAHEYMIHLLESMHKCCLPSGVPVESPSAYGKSLVHKIFGGRLRSQVKCLQCSYCSNTFDPFLDLSLEIVKADSLYKALVHFTAAEQLDGGERQYKCERCKQKVKALKQLTVCKAPYVLTIHLKRFRSHLAGQKIDKKVHFDSMLDLKPFVSGAYEGDLTYTLYGVLVHAGWSTHSGHYYCFVRTSSGLWYSLDDNRVVQVSEKTVLEQKAYMLFYVRDRKNFTPKKTMDIIQKENLITTMRNASSSCHIPNIKAFQNGCADKSSRETIPSALFVKDSEVTNISGVLDQQNVSKSVSSNKSALKKELSQKVNGTISSGTLDSRKEDPLLFKSDLVGTIHSRTESTDSSHARNSAKGTYPGVNNPQNSAVKPSIIDCPSSVATDGCDKYSHVIITAADTKVFDALPSGENGGISEKIGSSESPIQLGSESGKCKEGAPEPTLNIHSILSKSRAKLQSFDESFSMTSARSTMRRRSVKKLLKSRVAGMHLSTKMLLGASYILRKRGKCTRMKLSRKNVMKKQLLSEDIVSMDTGPSIYVRVSSPTCVIVDCHTKDSKLCLSEEEKDTDNMCATDYNSMSPVVNSVAELEGRITHSNNVMATGKLSSAKGSHTDVGNSKQRNYQLQNGATSAFTRPLEEIHVARWEGIESPSKVVESDSRNSFRIGYVLDDWDEEYDCGKRKKVRGSRNTFGGPNPFQEIAAKQAKLNA